MQDDSQPRTAHRSRDLDPVLSEALAWFLRLREREVSEATRAAFRAWEAASPEHARAYARVSALWDSPGLAASLEVHDRPEARARASLRRRPWAWVTVPVACLALLLWSGLATPWLNRWQADYATGAGEQQRVVLPDGSAATLDTASALGMAYREAERGVRLWQGKAYFKVAPDAERPFVVYTEAATVRVLGTEFSVSADARAEVAVRRGRVLYTAAAGLDAPVALGGGEGIAQDRSRILPPGSIDVRERFAWFEGRLIFRDRPLAEVLAEVERYLPGKILLMSRRLAATRVTGNYKLADPLAIVRSLAGTTNATVASATPYLVLLH